MFTVSTFAMLILGILAHALKQLVGAKRVGSGLAARQYFLEYWPETLLAVVCSLAMYFGLPESGWPRSSRIWRPRSACRQGR